MLVPLVKKGIIDINAWVRIAKEPVTAAPKGIDIFAVCDWQKIRNCPNNHF
jgi:hypothetical protein